MPVQTFRPRRHLFTMTVVAVAVAIVVIGLVDRRTQANQLQEHAARQGLATVSLVSPSTVTHTTLQLPGRIEAWSRAPIYARVSGYLTHWSVDIGGSVKAGQVLAEIETPDLDQQLLQAKAELVTARSEANQAASTARRWQLLAQSQAVSQQEVEERTSDLASKRSVVNALQANVERAQVLQRYKRIVAPFDGIVTARNTDIGSLINVGMTPGSELFVVSDVQRLRVYVNVPQRQLAFIRPGGQARILVPERPGKIYGATVESLSQAVDIGSGSMRVQLSVDNAEGELLPGAFTSVRFESSGIADGVGLPPSALIIGKNGVQVATVDLAGIVQLKPVVIARDHGTVIELADGLAKDQQVIANPPDGLASGDHVRIATDAKG
ncbi:efflux RND transporter periplasmic adaptor subunit [Pseudomonas sp. CCM 7891]|uniref:Efflux RND transporter periplasmic adaptor subunit n=1 Tax=Pseudomonas karstica TaxID=1055468 RepID=A0A7X2RSD7_9PSED|nr:efflux RND transporter periplasmic adaptor subunit [Pseudomonas karstica]MTD19359.1 efflux RND transporter periplasmic adaptor subunit [Pseudomonas karstica]